MEELCFSIAIRWILEFVLFFWFVVLFVFEFFHLYCPSNVRMSVRYCMGTHCITTIVELVLPSLRVCSAWGELGLQLPLNTNFYIFDLLFLKTKTIIVTTIEWQTFTTGTCFIMGTCFTMGMVWTWWWWIWFVCTLYGTILEFKKRRRRKSTIIKTKKKK